MSAIIYTVAALLLSVVAVDAVTDHGWNWVLVVAACALAAAALSSWREYVRLRPGRTPL